MNCTDALDLMQTFVDGELDESTRHRLLAHTRECDSCRLTLEERQALVKTAVAALESQARVPAGLAPAVSARISQEPALTRGALSGITRPASRFRRAGLAVAGAAAVVLIALAVANTFSPGLVKAPSWLALGHRTDEPLVAVTAAMQPATDGRGRALEVGDRLPAGATMRTGDGGRVTLVTRHGSEYTLNADTELSLYPDGSGATLRAGEVYCRSRRGEITRIDTEAGRIHLLGTTLDAAVQDGDSVAVTVLEGRVRLSNLHGEVLVDAGRQALLVASRAPEEGVPVKVSAETAWYYGRGEILSDFGDIVYTVDRAEGLVAEVWSMRSDGSNKRRVKSYLGRTKPVWIPRQQMLLVSTDSVIAGAPDLENHTIDTHFGHPIVGGRHWVLDAATGRSYPAPIPPRFWLHYGEVSPDGRRLVCNGDYLPNAPKIEGAQMGTWICDLETGDLTMLELFARNFSWSPDGRWLGFSNPSNDLGHYPMGLLDTATGEVLDLPVQGAGPSFSSDGTKLAYCGDFKRQGHWYSGIPVSGSIFVFDLSARASPRRISPVGEGALEPRWSPDGTQVLYYLLRTERSEGKRHITYTLCIAEADGSGVRQIQELETRGIVRAISWAPSGDAVYVVTHEGVLLVAADGSGRLADLGGNVTDGVLPRDHQAQTDEAVSALQEAFFQFVLGETRTGEGRLAEGREAFRTASEIFAEIPWRFPLACFEPVNLLDYADQAAERAEEPAPSMLHVSCLQRTDHLSGMLLRYASVHESFPSDFATLAKWIAETRGEEPQQVRMLFECPAGTEAAAPISYVYNRHAADGNLTIGDVIVACPEHPDLSIVWGPALFARLGEVASGGRELLSKLGDVP